MLKSKSLEDINCLSDGQLFTELTPQEAAAIEGGYKIYLNTLIPTKVGGGVDRIRLEANGAPVHTGKVGPFAQGKAIDLTYIPTTEYLDGSPVTFELFLVTGSIGEVTEDGDQKGPKTRSFSGGPLGNRSSYTLQYYVS